jgi:hypothetical protein
MVSIGLLYVGLWVVVGGTCGFLVRYGLNAKKNGPPYHKAWAIYAIGMVFCFGLLAGIYEIDRTQLLGDGYGWSGIAAMAISFFVLIWKTGKKQE